MAASNVEQIRGQSHRALKAWLSSCVRQKKLSRNTVAIGIVVLDHLRRKCPLARDDVLSQGGEVKGSRAGLAVLWRRYGIPQSYLKEATTRQSHQDGQRLLDALAWGELFCPLPVDERDHLLLELIGSLVDIAKDWLSRQNLKPDIDPTGSPATWIHTILENAEGHSGGIVEQHLVGAKLARRFPQTTVPNHPAHAADVQTDRRGDFEIHRTIFHVTGAPSPGVIEKCGNNLRSGFHPVLLVPQSKIEKARVLTEMASVEKRITIIAIEDFIALNIIEMATSESRDSYGVLKELLATYNQRIGEVETDLSLQIEVS